MLTCILSELELLMGLAETMIRVNSPQRERERERAAVTTALSSFNQNFHLELPVWEHSRQQMIDGSW